MIQRVQHLYLLLSGLIFGYFTYFPLVELENDNGTTLHAGLGYIQILNDAGTFEHSKELIPLLGAWICFTLSLLTIFFYKKRKLQLTLCYINFIFITATFLAELNYLFNYLDTRSFSIDTLSVLDYLRLFIFFFTLILNYLALKGIQFDEDLIKSADRLR